MSWNHMLNLITIQSVLLLAFTYLAGSKVHTECEHNCFFKLFSKLNFHFYFSHLKQKYSCKWSTLIVPSLCHFNYFLFFCLFGDTYPQHVLELNSEAEV